MKIYTKPELIEKLKEIAKMGWVPNARHGNQGGIGNTLEDLLGIEENNLPIPKKTKRKNQIKFPSKLRTKRKCFTISTSDYIAK